MADEQPSGRIKRFLDYLETISKILGGVSIPIAGLFVTLALQQQLFEIARDTTSRQVALLVRSGHLTEDIVVPMTPADNATPSQPSVSQRIALYSTRGLTGLNGLFVPAEDGWAAPPGPGADA